LFGLLIEHLGFGELTRWDFTIHQVVACAVLGALGAASVRILRVLWIADVILFAFLCLIELTPVMSGLSRRWVRSDPLPVGPVDAVVVPSSGVTSGGTLGVAGSDRLLAALELVRRGVAPKLITTRVAYYGSRELTSDADQRRLITMAGVEDRWIPLGDGFTTRGEAIEVEHWLRQLGDTALQTPRHVVVVTSPLHTRRACATFEYVGLRVTCRPVPERGPQTGAPEDIPDRLAAFRSYMYERLGWWLYRVRGWVRAG
jgi:uncharacterized SAM-binding protein YcdF (DUF218 family)